MDTAETVPDTWRPGRAVAIVPAVVAALATVWATSVPGWYLMWLALITNAWVFIGLIWLLTLGRMLFRREPLARLRREWPVWSLPPLIVLLVCGLLYVGAPLEARFALSRPALDGRARAISHGAPLPADDEWIGLFPVGRAERIPGGVRFAIDGTGFLGTTGFAWSPEVEPPEPEGEELYEHWHGPWYLWSESE
ncbi:hypothetical protein ACFFV7_40095 [Nonomuraea spiralis]|uniref:DUF1109 domain-containing protein n=1 Tax=Nonomuraea spiralis TaxID=46182 RepID=A0ABV5ITX4_9ACTN|nr:hypothetical protein [Nonomuraea spiralis]GGT40732.1 hypothetical protein GCM10010176_100660 [Nonomuraea spiralis]